MFSFSFSVYPAKNGDDGKMDFFFLPGRNFQYFGVRFSPLGILKGEIETFITKVI